MIANMCLVGCCRNSEYLPDVTGFRCSQVSHLHTCWFSDPWLLPCILILFAVAIIMLADNTSDTGVLEPSRLRNELMASVDTFHSCMLGRMSDWPPAAA